jgi:hypothetical protein
MVPVGVGAGLTAVGAGRTAAGKGRRLGRRGAIATFFVAGIVGALIFSAGHFGADVGAAIVLPVGAVVAAASLPRPDLVGFSGDRPKKPAKLDLAPVLAAVVAVPFIALLFLALIDLVSGATAHLTRSVLDAGGGGLADAAERRLELNAHDFGRAASNPLFWVLIAGVTVAISQRGRIDAWLRPAPAARAAFFGAGVAVLAGTLANDSGAAYLALGALAIGALLAFAWAQAPMGRKSRNDREIRVMRESAAGKY